MKLNDELLARAHPWLRPILEKRNVRFLLEFHFVIGYIDHDHWCDYSFGLPMMGDGDG